MKKPLFFVTGAMFLIQTVNAATPIYLWDNQEGLIPAKSCEIIPVSKNNFRISKYSGWKNQQTENLRNIKGVRQSHLINESLVKIIAGDQKRNYKKVEVVGINKSSNLTPNRWFSERLDQGYLYKNSLLPVEDYLLQVDNRKLSKKSQKIFNGYPSSYWFIESQSNYYKLECPNQSDEREYTLFRVYDDINSPDPSSYVGVYWDETNIFKNIKTIPLKNIDHVDTFEKIYDLDLVLSDANNKLVSSREKEKFYEDVKGPEKPGFFERLFSSKHKDLNETNDEVVEGQFQDVVCLPGNVLNVRNESLKKVIFKAMAGENVKIFQDWEDKTLEKTIGGVLYKYAKVEFSSREESDQNVGWIAERFITPKSKCKYLKSETEVNLPKNTKITGIDDKKCCEFPTVKEPTHSYSSGMRMFNARRGGGKRAHAACDLYRYKNEPILSVAPGVVVRDRYYFYQGTYALEIAHSGGFIARYGEITGREVKGVTKGDTVKMGSRIGYMGKVNSNCCRPMLHFELFKGDEKGALSQPGNKYKRRKDLLNPTPYLRKWETGKF